MLNQKKIGTVLISLLKKSIKRVISITSKYRGGIGMRGLLSLYGFLAIYAMLSRFGFRMHGKFIYCLVKGYTYPIIVRYETSDIDVFRQIFIEQEYSSLKDMADFKLIIDCGAYVGYSSLYFLARCPNAHVVAVEPDISNFSICKKNLSFYGKRVMLVHSAVYPYKTRLITYRENYRDGREWTTQVRPAKENENQGIISVDINTLIGRSGFDLVDLLKIDIERSEIDLFSHDCKQWLKKVRNLAIELHDKECEDVFFKTLSGFDFKLLYSGELTICKNISLP